MLRYWITVRGRHDRLTSPSENQISTYSVNVVGRGRLQPRRSTLTSRPRHSPAALVRVQPSRSGPSVSITCLPSASAYFTRQTTPRTPSYRITAAPLGTAPPFSAVASGHDGYGAGPE